MSKKLEMRGITKRFGDMQANKDVQFDVNRGEIHALLGENGAGKSTLMNILYGLYRPDEGEIMLDDNPVSFNSPADAIESGIGMVHQAFQLVQTMSVTRNVILGLKSSREPFTDEKAAGKKIKKLSALFGIEVDPEVEVWRLSYGEQQQVEILKALYRHARLLILDEPTSVLTPQETRALFDTLKALAHEGRSIIFISHKLNEVMEVSDRVTVMRDGRVIETLATAETTREDLARKMVGRDLPDLVKSPPPEDRKPILKLEDIHAFNDRGLPALKGLSFTLSGGEILGIAGVAGNGQKELAEVLTGIRQPTGGKLKMMEKEVTNFSPRALIDEGIAYIPEESRREAVFIDSSLEENAILRKYWRTSFSTHGLLSGKKITHFTLKLIESFSVRASGSGALARQLSGGNLQKFVLARELSHKPKLIVAAEPTAGLDVGASQAVRQRLLESRTEGRAVLLISSDLDEILSLSDRILVLYEGEIMGELIPPRLDLEELGLMMAGTRQKLQ